MDSRRRYAGVKECSDARPAEQPKGVALRGQAGVAMRNQIDEPPRWQRSQLFQSWAVKASTVGGPAF